MSEPTAAAPTDESAARGVSFGGRVAVLLGLLSVALVQPILDLLGNNPAFFVAGNYSSKQIIAFAVLVVVVPALLLTVATLIISVTGPLREVLFGLLVGALGLLLGNVIARGLGLDGNAVALVAGLLGGGLAYGMYRWRPGRMLLQYLAAANVLFLFGFLVLSPTAALVGGTSSSAELGTTSIPKLAGPVVVVTFDEFPVDVIMNPDGTVNGDRYPAFAELASRSTWYRNVSSDHHRTERAVPELLTGTQPPVDALPSYVDLPRNLLTLFATSLPVERYEAITDMCPPSMCQARPPGSMRQLVDDAKVVYGHRVLPPRLRRDLPAIDQAWGGFGGATTAPDAGQPCAPQDGARLAKLSCMSAGERWPYGQELELKAIGQTIVDDDPGLYFAHVITPHRAYTTAPALGSLGDDDPYGITTLVGSPPGLVTDAADPAYDRSRQLLYERASLQFGAADAALGDVIHQLKSVGAWDDATVVVMADHGVSLLPPTFGRETVDETNRDEVYRVPLFMKAPGQASGKVVDDPASTLDMLPTLIDLLGIHTDWDFDGHSLLDGSKATLESHLDPSIDGLMDLVDRHAEDVPPGDWVDLARVGPHADMVGKPLTALTVGEASSLVFHPDGGAAFGDLPGTNDAMPQTLSGSVATPGGDRPPELVVSVNGTIGGTVGGYVQANGAWRFGTVLGPYLVRGANKIVAYEVGDDGTLHPLRG